MERSDVSIVAVELSSHQPPKTMVLRGGERVGSPKMMSPMQPRPMKPFRMDEQWENTPYSNYGPGPTRQLSRQRAPERTSSRRVPGGPGINEHSNKSHRQPLFMPSPSPPSGSDYSIDEEQRSRTSGISTPDGKTKSESAEASSSTLALSADMITLPPVQVTVVPPLTKVHFSCYQSHRSFMVSKNAHYSVPCMTCLKSDQQVRWRCTFCALRVCGDCVKGISKAKDRSLMVFLEELVKGLEGSDGSEASEASKGS